MALSIPRFVDTSSPAPIVAVPRCQTTLLFPFVASQSGIDTAITIANTSADPSGAVGKSGTCTLTAYGANAPSAVVTRAIAAGAIYTVTASSIFGGFTGYVFATCAFPNGHGYALVADSGTRGWKTGYRAVVAPRDASQPERMKAESLGH